MTSEADAKMEDLSLTWGVEMELIFAFHESEIMHEIVDEPIGNRLPNTSEKDLPYELRARDSLWSSRAQITEGRTQPYFTRCTFMACPNRAYNSWGTRNSNDIPPQQVNPYYYEPLEIVRKHLSANTQGLDYEVFEDIIPLQDKTDEFYNAKRRWLVTSDPGVVGVGSENITRWLPSRVMRDGADDWDSYGIELNSPVFNTSSDQGKNEIAQCGLHVHVQAPESLAVLKKLALVLVVYEQEIALMHPQCRRPYHPLGRHHQCTRQQLESNRLGFVLEPDLTKFPGRMGPPQQYQGVYASYASHGDTDVSVQAIAQNASVALVESAINDCSNKYELSRLFNWPANDHWQAGLLGMHMPTGNRNRQVNLTTPGEWEFQAHNGRDFSQYPCTIEFRQAKGSLNAEDIARWVDFCVGLVRLAHFYDQHPSRFRVKHWLDEIAPNGEVRRENKISVFELMEDMNFGADAVKYWKHRMGKFQCFTPGDENDRCDDEFPPPGWVPEPPQAPPSGGPPSSGGGSGSGSSDGSDPGGSGGNGGQNPKTPLAGSPTGSGSSGGSNLGCDDGNRGQKPTKSPDNVDSLAVSNKKNASDGGNMDGGQVKKKQKRDQEQAAADTLKKQQEDGEKDRIRKGKEAKAKITAVAL
ncbi:hypothetical protein BDZ45DRAFT_747561 [Acephala macrosclerotiorum]|nr:hypothetical protein BDZ45DRAFT_747561 [Acephala macrosclerotiorum]